MNSSELALYLEAGFIDFNIETDERFLPKILTNNQQEQVKVLENLLFELEHCDEFFFSVAFVTNSGIACLIDTLKELENKHIKGKILASQYQNFTEPRALRRLLQFPNLELKIITSDYNFHAKGYLFHTHATSAKDENYTMIVGSSNLTQSALTVNREWNVQLSSMKDGALIRRGMMLHLLLRNGLLPMSVFMVKRAANGSVPIQKSISCTKSILIKCRQQPCKILQRLGQRARIALC